MTGQTFSKPYSLKKSSLKPMLLPSSYRTSHDEQGIVAKHTIIMIGLALMRGQSKSEGNFRNLRPCCTERPLTALGSTHPSGEKQEARNKVSMGLGCTYLKVTASLFSLEIGFLLLQVLQAK